jgi:hypothetical protein
LSFLVRVEDAEVAPDLVKAADVESAVKLSDLRGI